LQLHLQTNVCLAISPTWAIAVDNPHANRLTLHILAAVAQHEREMIEARTKAALQASKARGTRLGRNGAENLAPAYRAAAIECAKSFAPIIAECLAKGMSARAIAREFEARKVSNSVLNLECV
jgi:DNA invertase Pin-like site-specific DNA recombinase